jgi:periplasmic divalent cation tolerance protein
MEASFCILLTTAGSQAEAERLAEILVHRRLAACVQLLPITSFYTWQGKIQRDAEILMLIKTTSANYAQIEIAIRENHSYEIPEIIQVAVEKGFRPYLDWIEENTAST